MSCNHDCQQSDTCNCGKRNDLDILIFVVAFVFAASCIGYLWGGL